MTRTQPLKNYLRSARKRAGLSQEELAHLLGYRGGKLVSRYELFQRMPGLKMALAFELTLGVPVSTLFAGLLGEVRAKVTPRARVLALQLRTKPAGGRLDRKREVARRILDAVPGAAPQSS